MIPHASALSVEGVGRRVLFRLLPIFFMAVIWLSPGLARAHGGGPGLDYDACIRGVEMEHFVHFAAYQPQFNPFAEYCGTLPRAWQDPAGFRLDGRQPSRPSDLNRSSRGGRSAPSVRAGATLPHGRDRFGGRPTPWKVHGCRQHRRAHRPPSHRLSAFGRCVVESTGRARDHRAADTRRHSGLLRLADESNGG